MNHMGVVYSAKSSFSHPYICEEGYETVEQQCMSLLVAHSHNFSAERDLKTDTLHENV